MRVKRARGGVVERQQHVVVCSGKIASLQVEGDGSEGGRNFARPRSRLPIVGGGLALNERVVAMARAGEAAAAHVVINTRDAAVADA